jgi:hypothetical protein
MTENPEFHEGSGEVFADLGLENSNEPYARAKMFPTNPNLSKPLSKALGKANYHQQVKKRARMGSNHRPTA